MARIAYNSHDALAFEATRHIPDQGLAAWRDAVTRHLTPGPGTRMLDLGAGTGMWARAFTDWYDNIDVIAVEPSEAMRARCLHPRVLAGDAGNIPLADSSVDVGGGPGLGWRAASNTAGTRGAARHVWAS